MKHKNLTALCVSLCLASGAAAYGASVEQGTEPEETQTEDMQSEEMQPEDEAGSVGEAGQELISVTAENYPRVDGSTATLPLSSAVYRLLTGSTQAMADEAIVHTKTTNSYLRLINKEVDLLIVADKNEAVDAAIRESGVELEIKPIALDAFIFMTNEDNPVESLTKEQIVGIYSGQIKNWAEVGGADQEIVAFQRNENAGSQTAMKSLVMQGTELMPAEKLEIPTMAGLLEAVASYNNSANALGYSYYYYANLMYRTPGLRFMAVDGIMPDNKSVQDGSYPYVAQYYAVVRKDEPQDSTARAIFDWLTGKTGQELIADLGYIPVDPEIEPEYVHYDELAETPLPMKENELLMIMTGDHTILFYDKDGRLTARLDNAAPEEIAGQTSGMNRIEVIDADQPLVVSMKTGENIIDEYSGSKRDYRAGIYLPKNNSWLIEPEYEALRLLGNGLCTDTSVESNGKSLMKLDNTVIDSGEYTVYAEYDGFILGNNKFFDLDGNVRWSYEGYAQQFDKEHLIVGNNDISYLMDLNGNAVWAEMSGLSYIEHIGEWIVWQDANYSTLITDEALNLVTSESEIRAKNPDKFSDGESITLRSVSGDGKLAAGYVWKDFNTDRYFVCDENFTILREYPGNRVVFDMTNGYYLEFSGENNAAVTLTDIFTGEQMSADLSEGLASDSTLALDPDGYTGWSSYDDYSVLSVLLSDGNYLSKIFFQKRPLAGTIPGYVYLRKTERDNPVWIGSYYSNDETAAERRIYLDQDGNNLTGDNENILYTDGSFRCVKRGAYIYAEDMNGNLYFRVLAEDEEIEETVDRWATEY